MNIPMDGRSESAWLKHHSIGKVKCNEYTNYINFIHRNHPKSRAGEQQDSWRISLVTLGLKNAYIVVVGRSDPHMDCQDIARNPA